jgi:hypothetical protein
MQVMAFSKGTDFVWLAVQCFMASRGLAATVARFNDYSNWRVGVHFHGLAVSGLVGARAKPHELQRMDWAMVVLSRLLWQAVAEVWGVSQSCIEEEEKSICKQDKYKGISPAVTEGRRFGTSIASVVAECAGDDDPTDVRKATVPAQLLFCASIMLTGRLPTSLIHMAQFPESFVSSTARACVTSFDECWWTVLTPYRCSNTHDKRTFGRNVYEVERVVAILDIGVDADELHSLDKACLLRHLKNDACTQGRPLRCPWCRHESAVVDTSSVIVVGRPPTVIVRVVGPRTKNVATFPVPEALSFDTMTYQLASILFSHQESSAAIRFVESSSQYLVILCGGAHAEHPLGQLKACVADAMGAVAAHGLGAWPKLVVYEATQQARLANASTSPSSWAAFHIFPPELFGGCGDRALALEFCPWLRPHDPNVLPWQREWGRREKTIVDWVMTTHCLCLHLPALPVRPTAQPASWMCMRARAGHANTLCITPG